MKDNYKILMTYNLSSDACLKVLKDSHGYYAITFNDETTDGLTGKQSTDLFKSIVDQYII